MVCGITGTISSMHLAEPLMPMYNVLMQCLTSLAAEHFYLHTLIAALHGGHVCTGQYT